MGYSIRKSWTYEPKYVTGLVNGVSMTMNVLGNRWSYYAASVNLTIVVALCQFTFILIVKNVTKEKYQRYTQNYCVQ